MIAFMIGFMLSTIIVLLAYYKESLNMSGAVSAILLGTLLYHYGGPYFFFVLISFFVLSGVIGYSKDNAPSNRNAVQVISNGLLALIFAMIYAAEQSQIFAVLFFVSIGASASDTWSSEIGKRSKNDPYHILKWRPVDKGLSGGVSFLGLFGALAASLLYALMALVVVADFYYILIIFGFSFLGSLVDSILGVFQVKFKDSETGKIVEKKSETSVYFSGIKFLTNSGVNFITNLVIVIIVYFYFY